MSHWKDKSAIVTGAASGIGLSLSAGLIARGANVWMTDVNEAAVQEQAARLGDKARSFVLDVRNATAFRALTEQAVRECGQLDYLFNNAGIGVGGEVAELGTEHFDRITDVNIRGVTNGVVAAYPIMVKQRSGHIVNTASAGGLLPMPLMTPYSMSKHAVVGLTMSLRLEAETYGVNVSALCPTAIETPLLDTEGPADLETPWRPNIRRFLTALGGAPYPVDVFTDYALGQLERNKALVVAPVSGRIAVMLYRLMPGLVLGKVRKALAQELADRPA